MNEAQKQVVEKASQTTLPHPIIGKSKSVESVREKITNASTSRRDVVIIGEPGVGKGAVAKNIHYLSCENHGRSEPFFSVNVSILDDKEFGVVFFGFDRGAEGLPQTSKRGLLEQANGGTLLIEEIEEASFRNQIKLLNVINDRQTKRIGGEAQENLEIRFIMTMKADPEELVGKRKLLEDFYAKVLEFEKIEVAPLRDRPEDIPLLVRFFSDELCKELGMDDLAIDINAVDVLVRQSWRENIRELKAVVDKSVLFSKEGQFVLPTELVDEKTELVKMINNVMAGQEFVLDRSLDVIEKGIIERSLEKFGFNQSKAAQFLGMTEQTFRYKLKRLGIASARTRP